VATQYYYGTGRRKSATARVRLYPEEKAVSTRHKGFVINGKPATEYFSRDADMISALEPLVVTGNTDRFSISVVVSGGGITGQAGAIRHGIARALLVSDPDLRLALRKAGLLTRDARIKERKKPGLKRARKAPQYTKR